MEFVSLFRDRLLMTAGIWLAACGPALWESAEKSPPVAAAQPARPGLRIEQRDPAVMKILQEWETAAAKIHRLDCSFKLFSYDATFEVEKRAEGELSIETPTRARYLTRPAVIRKGEVSRKKNTKGDSFEVVPERPERWHWTGTRVIRIDDEKQTYESVSIPDEVQTKANCGRFWSFETFREFHLARPFLLGMPAQELIEQFKATLVKESDSEIWIEIEPRHMAVVRNNYQKATLILNRPGMLPKAIQMIDPTGNKVMVHVFSNMRINSAEPRLEEPSLVGLRPVLSDGKPRAKKSQSPK